MVVQWAEGKLYTLRQRQFMFNSSSEDQNTKMTNSQIHHTSCEEPAGICLNFSQACQNKMFSTLTSDLRKVCGQRNTSSSVVRNTMSNCSWACRASCRQVKCSSPWSGGLRRGPPAASRRTRPSSALCSPGRTPRQGFREGWCCCLRSPVQTCSVLQRIQSASTPSYQQANTDWQRD